MSHPTCLSCGAVLHDTVLDLGKQPLSNSYLTREQLEAGGEPRYPLHVRICRACLLVQVEPAVTPEEIFSDYPYFSSYSDSWLEHSARYTRDVTVRLRLNASSMVVEVASNDGYLLRNFVAAGIPVLGVEPAANVAEAALAAGIPTEVAFFGRAVAADLEPADLAIANNVLAHVPDLDDFVGGLATVLKPEGVLTVEAPHLLRMLEATEFDTIYHEHLCYFSLLALTDVLGRRGLRIWDVEELPTHGGSLRYHLAHAAAGIALSAAVERVLADERAAQMDTLAGYRGFADACADVKAGLLEFLIGARRAGRRVAAYGAPAKGNTLLGYCGVGPELVEYTVDRSPAKQGRFLPGSRIPVHAPEMLRAARPDDILILPWNLRDEIAAQLQDLVELGCRLVVAVPRLEVVAAPGVEAAA